MKFLWKKLYADVDSWREGRSWRALAKEKGVTPSVFTRISKGKPVSVENLLKILGKSVFLSPFDRWIRH